MIKRKFQTWGGCALIIVLMTLVSYVWKDSCNNWYFNGAHCFFLEDRLQDIKDVSLCVFWEEAVFRLAPILIASIIIALSKPKWLRWILYIVFAIIIVCIQVKFGALHYNEFSDTSYERPIIIHGVMGLILTITYVSTLVLALKNKEQSIKNVLIANAIAYCASAIVHAVSNVILVITQTA